MRTLLQCTYCDLAGKNINLEGQRLVLTLLASFSVNTEVHFKQKRFVDLAEKSNNKKEQKKKRTEVS